MIDDRTSQICQQMCDVRAELRDDAVTIVENAKLSMDWRWYLEHYPWLCAGAAVGIGYFLVPRRSTRFGLEKSQIAEFADQLKARLPQLTGTTKAQGKGMLMGIAIPLVAKLLAQHGLSLLQKRFFGRDESSGSRSFDRARSRSR